VVVTTVVMMLVFSMSVAIAQCGDGDCAVGAEGTGGDASGGNAQGFHFEGPGANPAVSITNSGNADSGRLVVDRPGDNDGTLAGTLRQDVFRGHGTGSFGDWSGTCDLADFPNACG
jgi:hypothetical protein